MFHCKTVMYMHLSTVEGAQGLGVLVCRPWWGKMPNQEEGARLPVGNDLQMQFYIYIFGLLCHILHMWLISNIVKICGADMFEALSQWEYCMQSPVASLIVGAVIGGNTEIVSSAKSTARLHAQTTDTPFACNCC